MSFFFPTATKQPFWFCTLLILILSSQSVAQSQDSGKSSSAPRLGESNQITATLGLEVIAKNGPCGRLVCSFPLPKEWPEQKITSENREATDNVSRIRVSTLEDGVRQAQFTVRPMRRGETAKLTFAMTIERNSIAEPNKPNALQLPSKVPPALRRFLKPSPFIETGHKDVKAAAATLEFGDDQSAWEKVMAIRKFTNASVEYSGVKALKGARRALQDGDGDCEERTSVFVALCRIKGIPARSVWIPKHAYAEFYLEEADGTGYWFPSESVGGSLGVMGNGFMILQKGDNFLDPVKRKRQRYITETATGKARRGEVAPVLRPIQDFEQRSENDK